MILLFAFAFLAGIITVLSPCILPILPIVLTSSLGTSKKVERSRPYGVVMGFILGFTFFTLFLSTIVRILGIPADSLRLFSVFVIALFGVSLLVPKFQAMTEQLFAKMSAMIPSGQSRTGFTGGLIIGLSIGLLWTPCVGPILASVISLAITGTVTIQAVLITFSYSLGTAIPMFAIIRGGQSALKNVPWLLKNLSNIQKIFGILMILTAVAIFFNFDRTFQTFILNKFPNYGLGLTQIEDNKLVRDQLGQKQNTEVKPEDMGKPMFSLLNKKGITAPELISGGQWFNSDPLTLTQLKGKVVIIDFWTYSCINCQRTLPYLKDWYAKYHDKGLEIIGVHAPEFEFEKSPVNVSKAIKDFALKYPVMQDNNFATWRAYQNQYWPAKYFIDKEGFIRYTHFGEGEYDKSEQVIQELLKEAGAAELPTTIDNPTYTVSVGTPESYLGYKRIEYLANSTQLKPDERSTYSAPLFLGNNQMSFVGNWTVMSEYANPEKGAILNFKFDAKEVYLVMKPTNNNSSIKVFIDDKVQYPGEDVKNGIVTLEADRLYKLVKLPDRGIHTLRLEFQDNNAQLFAFTFG